MNRIERLYRELQIEIGQRDRTPAGISAS